MADSIAVVGSLPRDVDEELSDEQMQAMLARAAKRRQEALGLKLAAADDDDDDDSSNKQFSFPKLNTGEIAKPYVSTTGHVAQIDSSRLLQEKDRVLSNKIRKVEDPVLLKQKTAEVRIHSPSSLRFFLPMRKIFPIFFYVSRVRAPSWLPFCKNDVLYIIVTLRHPSQHITFEFHLL